MHRRQFMAGAVATAVCGIAISGIVPGEAAARSGVHVYLVKGTLGMSPGLDELGEKLRRRGINATVHDLGEASALAVQAVQKYKSGRERTIVLIGHSSGGSAILTLAGDLDRAGVPIALAIPLDPPWAVPVPANVRRVINLYLSDGMGVAIPRGPKFHGSLRNVDLKNDATMGHFAISSSPKIHRQLIGYVLGAIGEPAMPAQQKEAPATPAQQKEAKVPL
jgi:hypothetical protein